MAEILLNFFDNIILAAAVEEVVPAVGIDPSPPRDLPQAVAGAPRFLFVGRFHPLKGVHLLLEAFARADIAGARLTLVGSGSDERQAGHGQHGARRHERYGR